VSGCPTVPHSSARRTDRGRTPAPPGTPTKWWKQLTRYPTKVRRCRMWGGNCPRHHSRTIGSEFLLHQLLLTSSSPRADQVAGYLTWFRKRDQHSPTTRTAAVVAVDLGPTTRRHCDPRRRVGGAISARDRTVGRDRGEAAAAKLQVDGPAGSGNRLLVQLRSKTRTASLA